MTQYLFLSLGVLIGFGAFFVRGYFLNRKAERLDTAHPHFLKSGTFNRLKDCVRHVVVEYSIRRKNHDFLLNVKSGDTIIFQLTHRSHYPELIPNTDDLSFGMALNLPLGNLTGKQKEKIIKIMKEESDLFFYEEVPFEYYVVDFGKRVKYTGYFLTRLLSEVFDINNPDNIEFELFSEGPLPYSGKYSNTNQ